MNCPYIEIVKSGTILDSSLATHPAVESRRVIVRNGVKIRQKRDFHELPDQKIVKIRDYLTRLRSYLFLYVSYNSRLVHFLELAQI